MVISILRLVKARVALLVLLALLIIVCGCSHEPILIEIHYQAHTSNDAPVKTHAMSSIEGNESQANADEFLIEQGGALLATPQTRPANASSHLLPTVMPSLQPTVTPLPTPTLTPIPTPTPTQTPRLTPTPLLTPSPSPTSDSLAAIEFEKERYENEIKRIQDAYDMRRQPLAAMLDHLRSKSAVSPEETAALQAEFDALQAEINGLESEASAELHAERERHLSTLAALGG